MKLTITVPDSMGNKITDLINGILDLSGIKSRVVAEPLDPKEPGAKHPRRPSRKEKDAYYDQLLVTGKWGKPKF